jgi:hypothetical protein
MFIFTVQVAFLQRHINLVDQLNFDPNLPRRFYTGPGLGKPLPAGDGSVLSLTYTAEVDLDIFRADPANPRDRRSGLSAVPGRFA